MEELQKQQQGVEPQASETSEPQGKTYDEDYVKSLRAEAAKYRTKAKELETSSKQAQQELMNKVFAALGLEPDPNKEFDKLLTEAQTKAQQAEARANERILQAEAKAQAAALGVKAERLPYLLKLADLSGVEFGENGEPNGEQIKAALNAVISDFPELVSQPTPARGGVPFNQPPQPNDLQSQLEKAIRDGDTTTAISLKRMMTFLK
jgi:hypothetical protein